MKKNIVRVLILLSSMLMTASVFSKPVVMVEEAIESESLSIKISKDLTGIVRGRVCDRCEVIVVKITPDTKLFIEGKPVALSKAASRSGKPGTVVFNIKTQQVTKIYSD